MQKTNKNHSTSFGNGKKITLKNYIQNNKLKNLKSTRKKRSEQNRGQTKELQNV